MTIDGKVKIECSQGFTRILVDKSAGEKKGREIKQWYSSIKVRARLKTDSSSLSVNA